MLIERLDRETAALQDELDREARVLLERPSVDEYRHYLVRLFGFVAPLERALLDTPGLDRCLDGRRLRKHLLLQHDLEALGLKGNEIASLSQCMTIPMFDHVQEGLGWSYVIERGTLGHATMFLHLASALPGELAFASSYLKCYLGSVGEMWRSFGAGVQAAVEEPHHANRIVDAAKAAYRHYRRWSNTLDGKPQPDALSDLTIAAER